MDSSVSTLLLSSSLELKDQREDGYSFTDTSVLQKLTNVPKKFVWPKKDLVKAHDELIEPLVDLEGFLKGDEGATKQAAKIIRAACLSHGLFQVINHGVDSRLLSDALDHIDHFFKLPLGEKLKAQNMPGDVSGYTSADAKRYTSKVPWKDTLTFGFQENYLNPVVIDFFKTKLGNDFEQTGMIYQKYCEAMKDLSFAIMELLAISLGVDRLHYKEFFQDASAIVRCNYYPTSQKPDLVLGAGPHRDPTSLTILHQDEIGGLEVFANHKWQTVRPRNDALVINLGDTFMALSNGKYKSCLHRALVHKNKERKSMAFFFCPREDKVVRPPEDLVCNDGTRMYPDFTWSEFLNFTQKHSRAEEDTLQNFTKWLLSSKPVNN